MSEALVVDSVHKSFGRLEVLRGVDLQVADHEVTASYDAKTAGGTDDSAVRFVTAVYQELKDGK